MVNTVSRHYVHETMTAEQGNGFEDLLRIRHANGTYRGIVNGVGMSWAPHFDEHNFVTEKAAKKLEVQNAFGIKKDPKALLIMMAARIDDQKGFSLIPPLLKKLIANGVNFQFVISAETTPNKGEEILAELRKMQEDPAFADRIGIIIPYSRALTQIAYAGADVSLVPSKFEPCGLVAPTAIMNGTVPVCRAVGGMVDIINHGKNGFLVEGRWPNEGEEPTWLVDGFLKELLKVNTMFNNHKVWHPFVARMLREEDMTWKSPAAQYEELYRETIDIHNARGGHYRAFGHFG